MAAGKTPSQSLLRQRTPSYIDKSTDAYKAYAQSQSLLRQRTPSYVVRLGGLPAGFTVSIASSPANAFLQYDLWVVLTNINVSIASSSANAFLRGQREQSGRDIRVSIASSSANAFLRCHWRQVDCLHRRLNRFFVSERLLTRTIRTSARSLPQVSIASSSANAFLRRSAGSIRADRFWSQSLLRQRTPSYSNVSEAMKIALDVSIASSSANAFLPRQGSFGGRCSRCLNRFFVSERLLTSSPRSIRSFWKSLNRFFVSERLLPDLGMPALRRPCVRLNRFFVSERLLTQKTLRACAGPTRLNRFFVSERLLTRTRIPIAVRGRFVSIASSSANAFLLSMRSRPTLNSRAVSIASSSANAFLRRRTVPNCVSSGRVSIASSSANAFLRLLARGRHAFVLKSQSLLRQRTPSYFGTTPTGRSNKQGLNRFFVSERLLTWQFGHGQRYNLGRVSIASSSANAFLRLPAVLRWLPAV